jgi:two-component system response regulator ChvI
MITDGRKCVAVIDDEADLANLFVEALNSENIKAIAFSDPLAAVDYLHDHHSEFCLVITDWRMPSISGLELAKLVQQMDSDVRIVIMSAFDLDKDQLRAIQKDEYLRKPMHVAQLIEMVKKQLVEPSMVAG